MRRFIARPRIARARDHPVAGRTAFDVASAAPEALSARTCTYAAAGAGIVVSKPVFGVVETAVMWLALEPVKSCHAVTVVAPFQLAYTAVEAPLARALIAGGSLGWPAHASR
jgi:hypothetical protein